MGIPNFSLSGEVAIGELSDIAGAALPLASSASSYISGSIILLNGGGLA
jgi:hypothetical protein